MYAIDQFSELRCFLSYASVLTTCYQQLTKKYNNENKLVRQIKASITTDTIKKNNIMIKT